MDQWKEAVLATPFTDLNMEPNHGWNKNTQLTWYLTSLYLIYSIDIT